ncbi:hypothetical protein GGI42DRAFT_5920 [Trichoderma sp. SZMC 28013]
MDTTRTGCLWSAYFLRCHIIPNTKLNNTLSESCRASQSRVGFLSAIQEYPDKAVDDPKVHYTASQGTCFCFSNSLSKASDRLCCLPQRAMQGSTGPMIHVGITTWERKRCRQEQQKQRIISRLFYLPLTQRRRNRSLIVISFVSPCFDMPLHFAHGLVGRSRSRRTFRANEERQSYGRTNDMLPFESKGSNLYLE